MRRWWWETGPAHVGRSSDLIVHTTVTDLGEMPARAPGPPPYVDSSGREWDGAVSGGIGVDDVAAWIFYVETHRAAHDAAYTARKKAGPINYQGAFAL